MSKQSILFLTNDEKLHHKSSAHHTSSSTIFVARSAKIYYSSICNLLVRTQAIQALNIIIMIVVFCSWILGSVEVALGSHTAFDTHTYYNIWVTDITKLQSACNKLIKINNLRNCSQRYTTMSEDFVDMKLTVSCFFYQ